MGACARARVAKQFVFSNLCVQCQCSLRFPSDGPEGGRVILALLHKG